MAGVGARAGLLIGTYLVLFALNAFGVKLGARAIATLATLKLTPVTDGGRTFAEWSAEFDCAPEREGELAQQIGQDVFQTAFDALKTTFRRQ